jgi:hypothetical protein
MPQYYVTRTLHFLSIRKARSVRYSTNPLDIFLGYHLHVLNSSIRRLKSERFLDQIRCWNDQQLLILSVSDIWWSKTGLVLRYKPVLIYQHSCECSASSTTQPLVQAIGIPQVSKELNHSTLLQSHNNAIKRASTRIRKPHTHSIKSPRLRTAPNNDV